MTCSWNDRCHSRFARNISGFTFGQFLMATASGKRFALQSINAARICLACSGFDLATEDVGRTTCPPSAISRLRFQYALVLKLLNDPSEADRRRPGLRTPARRCRCSGISVNACTRMTAVKLGCRRAESVFLARVRSPNNGRFLESINRYEVEGICLRVIMA